MSRKILRKSLRNKVILNDTVILNDSDNESSDKNKADASVIIMEHSSNKSKTPVQHSYSLRSQKRQLKNISKLRTRSSVILIDDESPSVSSTTQVPSLKERDINTENKAPLKADDDIVELWSCVDRPPDKKKEMIKDYNDNQTKVNSFTIDKKKDMKNVDYLKLDVSPVRKKLKVWRYYEKDSSFKKLNTHVTQNLRCKKQKTETYNQSNITLRRDNITKLKERTKWNNKQYKLREIVVDGCNVAMSHTNGREFSVKGISLVVDYFKSRGHAVKVFLPQHIRRREHQLLEDMYKDGIVVFTPSRNIGGKRITSYEDRYILEYATKCEGIVISSDQYRDLYQEKPEWRETIVNRLLIPTFVDDVIMFPEDPLGRFGPDLDTFLRH